MRRKQNIGCSAARCFVLSGVLTPLAQMRHFLSYLTAAVIFRNLGMSRCGAHSMYIYTPRLRSSLRHANLAKNPSLFHVFKRVPSTKVLADSSYSYLPSFPHHLITLSPELIFRILSKNEKPACAGFSVEFVVLTLNRLPYTGVYGEMHS